MIAEVRREIGYTGKFLSRSLEIPIDPFPGLVVSEGGQGIFVVREVVVVVSGSGPSVMVYADRVFPGEAEDMLERGGWSKS